MYCYLLRTLGLTFFSLVLSVSTVIAECDPNTVQFYLDKGFTPDQITELCTHSDANKTPAYEPYQKPVVIYQDGGGGKPGYTREEQEAEKILAGGLQARAVNVTKDKINYIREICLLAGNTPERDQRAKDCVEVAFSIKRKNLAVLESSRSLFVLGNLEITVQGDIQRKFVHKDPFGGFSPDIKRQFEAKYQAGESGNTTDLPIRKGESVARVVSAIRTLSLTADDEVGEGDIVDKIFADEYVPPEERTPEPVAESKEEKKGGRWWNPFD